MCIFSPVSSQHDLPLKAVKCLFSVPVCPYSVCVCMFQGCCFFFLCVCTHMACIYLLFGSLPVPSGFVCMYWTVYLLALTSICICTMQNCYLFFFFNYLDMQTPIWSLHIDSPTSTEALPPPVHIIIHIILIKGRVK